jgi:hypothetical protein
MPPKKIPFALTPRRRAGNWPSASLLAGGTGSTTAGCQSMEVNAMLIPVINEIPDQIIGSRKVEMKPSLKLFIVIE